jgi:hypothetical protein
MSNILFNFSETPNIKLDTDENLNTILEQIENEFSKDLNNIKIDLFESQFHDLRINQDLTFDMINYLIDKIEINFICYSEEKTKLIVNSLLKELHEPLFKIFDDRQLSILKTHNTLFNQSRLIEAAKEAAAQDGYKTSEYIQQYGITDQKELIEIAKIAAAQDGGGTSAYIGNYGITDQKALIEIARIAVEQAGSETSAYIRNYGIDDDQILFAIFLEAFIYDPFVTAESCSFPDDFCPQLATAFAPLQDLAKARDWSIQRPLAFIATLKDPKAKKTALIWFAHFLGSCLNQDLSKDQFDLLSEMDFITHTLDYCDPLFRYRLTETMLQVAIDKNTKKFVASHVATTPSHGKLSLLLLSALHTEGVSQEICDHLIAIVNHHTFRRKNLKNYIKTLHLILKNKELNGKDKQQLLSKVASHARQETRNLDKTLQLGDRKPAPVSSSKFINQWHMIAAILKLNGATRLKGEVLLVQEDLFSNILQVLFQEQLPIKPMIDFTHRYMKYFGEARVPHYICAYIAATQSLKDDRIFQNTLTYCVEGILEDNLKERRYNLNASSHMHTIFSQRKTLLEQWKEGETTQLKAFLKPPVSAKQQIAKYDNWILVDTDDAQDLFLCGTEIESCQKVTGDCSLNKCLLAYVLDGKNRLLAIKDSAGKIMARGILRILWNATQPVLFLERLYPTNISPEMEEALKDFAKQRAYKLDLPLFNEGANRKPSSDLILTSLGSIAPFEYSDSVPDRITDGTYQISNVHILQL